MDPRFATRRDTRGEHRVIRVLDRLIVGTFLKLFVLVLLACPPIFVIADIAENLDTYIDRGLTGVEVAWSYLYQTPLFI